MRSWRSAGLPPRIGGKPMQLPHRLRPRWRSRKGFVLGVVESRSTPVELFMAAIRSRDLVASTKVAAESRLTDHGSVKPAAISRDSSSPEKNLAIRPTYSCAPSGFRTFDSWAGAMFGRHAGPNRSTSGLGVSSIQTGQNIRR